MPAKGSKNRLRRADWDNARVPVTVDECGENSRGEISEIREELDRARRAERGGDWGAHRGWEEGNWIIYLRDTNESFIHGSYMVERHTGKEI